MGTDTKIFLVDDDAFCINIYQEYLQNLGFTNLFTFFSGNELLANLDKNPDVIFLDYYLDDYKATELLEKIKIINPDAYVVIVSGQSDMEITINMLTNGAFDYIVKDNNEARKISEVMGKLIAASAFKEKLQTKDSTVSNKKNVSVIIEAQEKVRKEIAYELHDNISQLLGASKLYIDLFIKNVSKGEVGNMNLLDQSKQIIETAITEVRKISRSLNGSFVKNINLKQALLQLIDTLSAQDSFNVQSDIQLQPQQYYPTAHTQHEVYRIIQELLNNILKHSAAKNIYISVGIYESILQVKVTDDGVGFNTALFDHGEGIDHIIKRIAQLQGTYSLQSSVGAGCIWNINIPVTPNKNGLLN